MGLLSAKWSDSGQFFSCSLVEIVVEDAERLLHHLRLSLHEDELHGSVDGVLVGSLKRALFDSAVGGDGFCSVGGEAVCSFGGEHGWVGEGEGADLAHDSAGAVIRCDGDAAVGGDVNGAGGNGDGLLVSVEDGFALAGLKDASRGALEGSVACVLDALGSLDSEETTALDG